MPKTKGTRKQQALELLKDAQTGPRFDDTFAGRYSPMHAKNEYLLWAETYIIPQLKKLIPELKETKQPAKQLE